MDSPRLTPLFGSADPADVKLHKAGLLGARSTLTARLNAIIMGSVKDLSSKGDIVADVNYFPALGTPIPTSAWKKRYLGVGDDHTRQMVIYDIHQTHQQFDLDTNGFKFVKLRSKQRVNNSSDEETIRQEYYPELEELAKDL
jgi:hypothetical protein